MTFFLFNMLDHTQQQVKYPENLVCPGVFDKLFLVTSMLVISLFSFRLFPGEINLPPAEKPVRYYIKIVIKGERFSVTDGVKLK